MKFNENKLRETVDAAKNRLEKKTVHIGKMSLRLTSALIYLGCFLCAFFVWANVTESSAVTSVRKFDNVNVVFEGESALSKNDLAVFEMFDSSVSITVEGAKNKVDKLTEDDVVAYVDVSEVSAAGNIRLSVSVEGVGKLNATASPSSVKVFIDEKTEMDVPVNVIPTYSISQGYDMMYSASTESVKVSGPKSIVENIKEARVTPELGELVTGTTASSPIILVDANGSEITSNYISTDVSSVVVKVDVFAEKTVPLTYSFKYGYIKDKNVKVTLNPAEITLRGDPMVLAKISQIPIIEIDETKLDKNAEIIVNPPLPEGVKNMSQTNRYEVDVELLRFTEGVIEIPGSAISVKNPYGHTYSLGNDVYKIRYIVDSASVKKVNASGFLVELDLTSLGPKPESSYSITPSISVSDLGFTLYPIDIDQISLTIIGANS